MTPSETLTIGELAEKIGVRVDTIRYYEKIGLLEAPNRSSGNHRVYDQSHARQLSFIVSAREYEFSLKDIEILLGIYKGSAPTCCQVKALTDAHLARIHAQIERLTHLEQNLKLLTEQCRNDTSTECVIVQELAGGYP